MSSISPEHAVAQYILGYKLIANVAWYAVDNVLITVNSEKFHWILVVFLIRERCLYVYDSLMGGEVHTKKETDVVKSLATMLPLFFISVGYYGKWSDIDWHLELEYVDKPQTSPLKYHFVKLIPQQLPESKYVYQSFFLVTCNVLIFSILTSIFF